MKTKLTFLMLLVITALQAQVEITATHLADSLRLNQKVFETKLAVGEMITIQAPNGLNGYKITITNNDAGNNSITESKITNDAKLFKYKILDDQFIADYNNVRSPKQISANSLKLTFSKDDAAHTSSVIVNIKPKEEGGTSSGTETMSISDFIDGNFRNQTNFMNPYDDKHNKVFLYFNENGKMLNSQPVNVDQNDEFHFIIACYKKDKDNYDVEVLEGIYSPSDLTIRPFKIIKNGTATKESTGNASASDHEPTQIEIVSHPFTSETFKFQISYYDSTEKKYKHSKPYSFTINKLNHVGIGVSYIGTNLASPDFRTIFNGTDTTIQSYNGGSRSMLTFNAIWYWSVLQQDHRGSIITSGRDILKDEPSWSFRRVFPTVGISLDGKFDENLFVGAVYEFARGGSIIGGMHYGKVKRLAMKDFTEGVTKFSGKDADIKTENVFKTSWFIGVNLDTRIFNTLFNKQ